MSSGTVGYETRAGPVQQIVMTMILYCNRWYVTGYGYYRNQQESGVSERKKRNITFVQNYSQLNDGYFTLFSHYAQLLHKRPE